MTFSEYDTHIADEASEAVDLPERYQKYLKEKRELLNEWESVLND